MKYFKYELCFVLFLSLICVGCAPKPYGGRKVTEWTIEIGNPVIEKYQATFYYYQGGGIITFIDTLGTEHTISGPFHIYTNYPQR